MNVDLTGFYQIAISLASHYDSLYYVEIESGDFIKFTPSKLLSAINLPESGTDFFTLATKEANKSVHPDDLEDVLSLLNKEAILEALSKKKSYSVTFRLFLDGKTIHVRHVNLMCEDKKHILCCLENIEAEFQEKAEQKKNLQSAERMARRDELTGIKNKNAFAEQSLILDNRIKEEGKYFQFGIVMCDVNDLKMINDTRGHSFGDEAIQRTSRIICDIFKHSPVFRIGGDEFSVILQNDDLQNRDALLKQFSEAMAEISASAQKRVGPRRLKGLCEEGASDGRSQQRPHIRARTNSSTMDRVCSVQNSGPPWSAPRRRYNALSCPVSCSRWCR
jgi:diguanylate cyclase (GGDEF)-like protein